MDLGLHVKLFTNLLIICISLMTWSVLEVLAVNHPYLRGITSLPMAGSHPTKESQTVVTVGSVVEVPWAKPDIRAF